MTKTKVITLSWKTIKSEVKMARKAERKETALAIFKELESAGFNYGHAWDQEDSKNWQRIREKFCK